MLGNSKTLEGIKDIKDKLSNTLNYDFYIIAYDKYIENRLENAQNYMNSLNINQAKDELSYISSKVNLAAYDRYKNQYNNLIKSINSIQLYEDYDDSRFLSENELRQYTKAELAYIRNEIFARHGYVFEIDIYKEYFNRKPWYYPDPNFEANTDNLNEFEKYNVKLIKELENKL